MIALVRNVSAIHRARYGAEPLVAVAPGRVNLIGEHTDYNDGFVFPIAIDRYTAVAVTPRDDDTVVAYSTAFNEETTLSLGDVRERQPRDWSAYLKGIAFSLLDSGCELSGCDLTIGSDVPLGAGLSSSASFEVATGSALLASSNVSMDPVDLALAAQRSEHEYVGIRCGIMDQLAVSVSEAGYAMLLDCRTLQRREIAMPRQWCVAVCDSLTRHQLAGSEYNDRRRDCETAAQTMGVPALRDATMDDLERVRARLDDRVFRRAKHVIAENDRTLDAAQALADADGKNFGDLMAASHESLRTLYEVSTPELDELVQICSTVAGVFGARMTGGGFGGSVVALLQRDAAEELARRLAMAFYAPREETSAVFIVEPAAGARLVSKA
ncbi:MAG: galactokinase [Candidatus Eremiobacteraeota bacterium]|nr:galactokinase [Candidatus Eremiobacteraeota bacterium]